MFTTFIEWNLTIYLTPTDTESVASMIVYEDGKPKEIITENLKLKQYRDLMTMQVWKKF